MGEFMNKAALLVGVFISMNVFAETTTFDVDGPHCLSCGKMIEKSVCQDQALKETFASCKVTVDEKTQTGKVIVENKSGKTLDTTAIAAAISKPDPDTYIVTGHRTVTSKTTSAQKNKKKK